MLNNRTSFHVVEIETVKKPSNIVEKTEYEQFRSIYNAERRVFEINSDEYTKYEFKRSKLHKKH